MAEGQTKRIALAGVTLLTVAVVGFAMLKNVSKRRSLLDSPHQVLESYPDYAPALLKANAVDMAAFGSAKKLTQISEGTLVFSEADAAKIKKRAKLAMTKVPLSGKPVTQIATADFLRTLNWSDRDMLMFAKSRNARDRNALMALSYVDLRSGNFDHLFDLFDLRHRLGNLGASDLKIVQSLSALPDQREIIETKMASAPSWGADYFRASIPTWTAAEINRNRASLFIFLKAQDDAFVRKTLISFYFRQLKRVGLYETAIEDWAALPEVKAAGVKNQPIYNTKFENLTVPEPFNWKTYEAPMAFAEIEEYASLYASSRTPNRVLLAQQLTTAPTGQALSFKMDGKWLYRERQGYFFWRLSCMPSRAPYHDIVVGDDARDSGEISVTIPPLPEDCRFQDLQLLAEPGVFDQRISMRASHVSITPTSGGFEQDVPLQSGGMP